MILHYQGGNTAEVEITKSGSKWIYFQTKKRIPPIKYRMNKNTGEIQVSPYWSMVKGSYVD